MHEDINSIKQWWTESNSEDSLNVTLEDISNLKTSLYTYNENSDLNMTFGQNFEIGDYTFRQGYYSSFKSIIENSAEDSDSMGSVAIFVARHYLELSLKDAILDLQLTLGKDIPIKKRNNHQLDELIVDFKMLMDWEDGKIDNTDQMFIDIILLFHELSPKNDEFRYSTDRVGNLHFPIEQGLSEQNDVLNLGVLLQYVNYANTYFQNLFYILSNGDDSLMGRNGLNNPFIIAFVHFLVNSSEIKSQKDRLTAEIINSKIEGFKYRDSVNANCSGSGYPFKISINGSNAFSINIKDNEVFISTKV